MTYEKNVRLSRTLVSTTASLSLLALWALCFAPLPGKLVASSLSLLSCIALLISDRKLITMYEREINDIPWIVCCSIWCVMTIYLGVKLIS